MIHQKQTQTHCHSRWLSICLKGFNCSAIITSPRLKLRCIKLITANSLNKHKSILHFHTRGPLVQSCALSRLTGGIPNNVWESAPVTDRRKWCIARWLGTMQSVFYLKANVSALSICLTEAPSVFVTTCLWGFLPPLSDNRIMPWIFCRFRNRLQLNLLWLFLYRVETEWNFLGLFWCFVCHPTAVVATVAPRMLSCAI